MVKKAKMISLWEKETSTNFRRTKGGFTTFELLMVVAIMVVMVATILRIRVPDPRASRAEIVSGLNNLMQAMWQGTKLTRRVHRVIFTSVPKANDLVDIQREVLGGDKPQYEPAEPTLYTHLELPSAFRLHRVYVEGKELLNTEPKNVCAYLIAEGRFQEVIVHIYEGGAAAREEITYKLDPISGTFEELAGFVRPERKAV